MALATKLIRKEEPAMLLKSLMGVTAMLLITGCASQPDTQPPTISKSELDSRLAETERRAYAEGVREVMQDMAGKLRAEKRYVYEPSVQTCGVQVPGRIANGSYIPPHETCVIESRGRFIEREPVVLPEIGGGR